MSSVKEKPSTPTYWRSLSEYENDPEFQEFVKHEFAAPLADTQPSSAERRRFLQLMAASFAFAGVTGCRWKEDKLVPFTRRPEGMVPGVPNFYNTAMELNGHAVGLRVKSYDGRPIKVEGNPDHPDSKGAASIYHQASILEMYDPDRSQKTVRFSGGKSEPVEQVEFQKFAREHFTDLRNKRGEGLRILAARSSSPSVADMKARFAELYPVSKWFEYEPVSDVNATLGSVLAFGSAHRAHYAFDQAQIIVSFDADFLGTEPNAVANNHSFAQGRQPETGKMSRLYCFESGLTITGAAADHRLALRSEQIKAFAAALDAALSAQVAPAPNLGSAQPKPAAKFLEDANVKKLFDVLVKDLVANAGASVVTVGTQQPAEVHALAQRINAVLGNVGKTVSYTAIDGFDGRTDQLALKQLADDINGGRVKTLVFLDTNPVYNAPGDTDFAELISKVETSIHFGLYLDETGRRTSWHVPMAHYLESWGDARAYDGTISITQPLIAPLYQAKSLIELLGFLIRDSATGGLEIVRRTHAQAVKDDRAWRAVVHAGKIEGSQKAAVTPELKALSPLQFSEGELSEIDIENGKLELSLALDTRVYDGRFANNGWLMELPDAISKLTWDNAIWINPETADKLGVKDATLVELSLNGRSLKVPALLVPGQAPGSIRLALGYGRTAAGIVAGNTFEEGDLKAEPVGVNAYKLRGAELWHYGSGLKLRPTDEFYPLATTQDKHAIDQVGREGTQQRLPAIVREAHLSEYKEHPDFAQHVVHHPPLLSLWEEPRSYDGQRWGLNVDLNKCTGCNACVIACQAENNIPVVGKDRVIMGREMQWMRIDRYFKGEPNASQIQMTNQPVMCQQCEHAPCEQVCPVGATSHNSEGLNDMTYNRCIGTRYCSNNCPYKVRRFNYFNFHEDMKDERNQVKGLAFNPEVTVRSRGVMEKCTYCVQRINVVRITAHNEKRAIKDGEIKTACQETCPSGAIVFGDLNDKQSKVAELHNRPRSYALLGELNVRPRTNYLARIRNPHSDLG